jgi:glycosyltransferase involved in cell wall biosynthesis
MKILHALGWYFPEKLGGTEIYVRGLCERLRASGCSVAVAAPEAGASAPRTISYEGVEVFRYPIPAFPTKAEAQSRTAARGAEHFHRWLAFKRPAILHVHSFVTGLGIHEIEAAKSFGVKVVATTHLPSLGWICQRGTLMRFGETPCDGLTLPRRCSACELEHRGLPKPMASMVSRTPASISRWMQRRSSRLATALGMPAFIESNIGLQRRMHDTVDAFVVKTEQAARIVAMNGVPPGKLFVNPPGIVQANVELKPGPIAKPTRTPITVGYLGRFDEIKGVLDLAEAFERLPKSLPLRLEFRGPIQSEQDRSVVARIRRIIGDDPRVAIDDAVPAADVPDLLRQWDVACFPARCLEAGPMAALEARAVGTPVVGARIGGLAEFIADDVDGALVEPADVGALSALLQRMVDDPAKTIDRWRANLTPPRTMDEIAGDYLALYRRLAPDQSAAPIAEKALA